MAEAISQQATFPLADEQGTLVGFYTRRPAGPVAAGLAFPLSEHRPEARRPCAVPQMDAAKARASVTAMDIRLPPGPLPRVNVAKPLPERNSLGFPVLFHAGRTPANAARGRCRRSGRPGRAEALLGRATPVWTAFWPCWPPPSPDAGLVAALLAEDLDALPAARGRRRNADRGPAGLGPMQA